MGEVFRARDTRLDRSVAIKVLPAEFADNAQLKLRFEREAKTISQLSHPNICTLYDVGDNYLVMELLDGETLADRISRGPLPLEQVIRIGIEIANALDRAHKAGVVHRDLKPSNVMLTKSGAKLLDFGLAREAAVLGPRSSVVETMRKSLTEEGAIVGTIQYMAPEQLEGGAVDARTDIFALGALLYEMVTGKRAFEGKSKASVIASILAAEPQPITAWQPASPAALDRLIRTCLNKDPDERWQNARDVALELRLIADLQPVAERKPRRGVSWVVPLLAAILAAVATWAVIASRREQPAIITTSILPPSNASFAFGEGGAPAISPDGKHVAFVARVGSAAPMLYVRALSADAAQPLAGTQDASMPFWSPDNRSIGFFAAGKLKKIDASGGPVESLADAVVARGGTWSSKGVIVYSPANSSALYKVSEDGGGATPVTQLRSGETTHRFPSFLPDGEHFVYQALRYGGNAVPHGPLFVSSINGGKPVELTDANSSAIYSRSGHLLYLRDRSLVAQKFDPNALRLSGKVTPITDVVGRSVRGEAFVSVSDDGTLVYDAGDFYDRSQLQWVDATGKHLGDVGKSQDIRSPNLSHDGRRVAVSILDPATASTDIWVIDLERGGATRLTFSSSNEFVPIWSPDDSQILYGSSANSAGDLMVKPSSGTGAEEILYNTSDFKVPYDWSADGTIVFQNESPQTGWDIWTFSMRDHRARPFLQTPAQEFDPKLSPDGRWIAYHSDESVRGRYEIYVLPIAGRHGKWQISSDGGRFPQWSHDGKHLFYMSDDSKLMSVDITTHGDEFSASVPRALFPINLSGSPGTQYAVAADGRFLVNVANGAAAGNPPITLVQNWTSKLK